MTLCAEEGSRIADQGLTTAELDEVAKWSRDDPRGWFNYVKERWETGRFGRGHEEHSVAPHGAGTRISAHTAGITQNDELIIAMQKNMMLWSAYWLSSKRGGHYVFWFAHKQAVIETLLG